MMQDIQSKGISQRTKNLINNLLVGRFTLVEIARITDIPEQLLQDYLNTNFNIELQKVLF